MSHGTAPKRRSVTLLATALVALVVGAAGATSVLLLSGWRKPAEQRYNVSFFLKQSVTAAQTSAIRTELEKVPAVKDLRYESKEEALAKFKEMYKDKPEMIEAIEKSGSDNGLPVSFRLDMKASDFDCRTMEAIRALPGVEQYSVVMGSIDENPVLQVRCH
ncbi:hypothetical protein ACWT_4808 [Actinoplanes sp. SE50]|nr:hypothetical protein ACPL_4938 [Actinoplanes sp. SE50/110]ATO84223.1 hypothetical protein ACWT_4808 [Actinoplanes sp. SE50]SLM01633.1 hypothetical protein ACSP50_4869 [Actinoplanes sp. SE50/110]